MEHKEIFVDIDSAHEKNVFGELDSNVKFIESSLGISIVERNGSIKITGPAENADMGARLIGQLAELSKRGNTISKQNVEYTMSLLEEHEEGSVVEIDKDLITNTVQGRPVKPKTVGQKKYVDSIRQNMVTFGIGPAGTGKTYLAMAVAIKAFRNEEVGRIILTRPAIEAGEKLGFLPGDLQSKIDPYLRPLYDALYEIMGAENFIRNSEKGLIEVAPLAYMRGRTLDNAFIILDEAQNTTPAQMKMFLTRLGFGSKAVITGDRTQKDLPRDVSSGLDVAQKVLGKIEGIGFIELTSRDVIRHPLVQKIVKAYDDYESAAASRKRRTGKKK